MVMSRSSSLTQVSTFIGRLNQEKPNTVRQRLKEWYQEAKAKKGQKRSQLEVSSCFAPLLRWVLSLLPADCQHLPLALDATNIKQNFTVLSINVLYRGCAIPIAWKVVKATQKGTCLPYWQQLVASFKEVIPTDWQVIVCADRGLYADWLYKQIVAVGWHPFLRINHQGTFRREQETQWHTLSTVVCQPGQTWSGQVSCFKTNPLACTLLARWDEGYQDPWLIVTDLAPTQADALWYGLRAWTECGYRDLKSDGWQWHKTRLIDPLRAERHWLALAVATLWIVTLGGESDAHPLDNLFEQLPAHHVSKTRPRRLNPPRQISCFLRGLLTTLADLLNGAPVAIGRLFPLSWTCSPAFSFPNSS